MHPVVNGDLGVLLGDQARLDNGAVGVHGLTHEPDLLAAVELDLRDVGALEQIGEELDELVALGLRAGCPVTRERALGRLAEVEDVVGDLADRGAAIPCLARLLELRIIQDLDGPIDLGPELVGWRTRPDLPRAGGDQQQRGSEGECLGKHGYLLTTPCRRCTSTATLRNRPAPPPREYGRSAG